MPSERFSPVTTCSYTIVVTVVLLVASVKAQGAVKADYYNLLSQLQADYKKEVRPVNDFSRSTDVYLTFSLLSIVEVNEQDQTLLTNAQLELEWYDEYLAWTEENHQNISTILLPQKTLWLPDVVVGNTVSSQQELGYENLQLRLYSSGALTWTPSGVFETSCEIDITFYPFDTQVCSIVFQTAVSLKSEITIYIDKTNPIDISEYSKNGLWDLLDSSAKNLGEEDSKTKIEFKIQIQRRRNFYILNIILPILFLSLTSSLTFALPADAGEKMGLSITILLAYAVYLTLVTDSMPSTSVQVSVLTVYLVILLALTAASVVLSVWILSYHHMPENRPVSSCMARLTMSVRKILCMPLDVEQDNAEGDALDQAPQYPGKPKPNSVAPFSIDDHGDKADDGVSKRRKTGLKDKSSSISDAASTKWRRSVVTGRVVAETFDRLIFCFFLSISLLATVACLLALGVGAITQERNTALPKDTNTDV